MHELSIVMSIVDIAEEQVRQHQAKLVESIDLDIGSLASIEMEALNFAWQSAVKQTVLSGAERRINHIQARARCLECDHEHEVASLFEACPRCGSIFSELLQGKELRVRSLVVA